MRIQDIRRTIVVVGLVAISSCRGGCGRGSSGDRALTVQGRLAPFPAAARVVIGVDVAQLRASPAAAKVQQLAVESQADQITLAEFQRRTGFDPIKQLSSLTAAFPEDARGSGDFGLVLRADHFDEARLVAYVPAGPVGPGRRGAQKLTERPIIGQTPAYSGYPQSGPRQTARIGQAGSELWRSDRASPGAIDTLDRRGDRASEAGLESHSEQHHQPDQRKHSPV